MGEIEYVQAAWLTVNVCAATVSVPDRERPDVFASTEYPTGPLPLPLAPDVTCNHGTFAPAVQVQPVPAVTVIVPGPPPSAALWLVGEIEYVQGRPPG